MNNSIQFEVNSLLRMASLLDENSIKRKEYINQAEYLLELSRKEKDLIKEKMEMFPKWVIENKPQRNRSIFISYKSICEQVLGYIPQNPSLIVKEALLNEKNELYIEFGIGLQFGVKSNDKRGIRIYSS